MSARWRWFVVDLRCRWRETLGLVVLVGVVAGASLAAGAGARRTDSAYPRFLARYGGFDTAVTTGGHAETDRIFAEIATLPQVVATSRSSLFLGGLTARGHTVTFPDVMLIAEHEPEGVLAGGVKVLRGRLPDPDAIDEAVANYAFAERLGLVPGDAMSVSLTVAADDSDTAKAAVSTMQAVRLVGVVAVVGSFETFTGRGFPNLVGLTPAFFRAHRPAALTDEDTMGVALRHGESDLAAFAAEIRRRQIPLAAPPQAASVYTSDVQAVNRVPVVTLWAASGLLALTGVVIVGQALARGMAARSDELATLRALGMSRATRTSGLMANAVLVGVGGAVVAVGVALAASPLMPLGLARIAEPSPGLAADWPALGIGAAATLVAVSAVSVVPARRLVRRAEAVLPGRSVVQPGRIAAAVGRVGLPTSMTSGLRLATRASGPAEPVPVRTAFVGTCLSIAALTAALVFASSLTHLVQEPRLFGYAWDAAVIAEPENLDAVADSLPRNLVADTWKGRVFASVRVEGLMLGAFASDGPPPSIITGRSPEAPDEIALDPKTLDRLHKGLNDTVSVTGPPGENDEPSAPMSRRMRIVGSFAVPRLPFQSDENPGQAAAFTSDGLSSISANADNDGIYLTLRAGVDSLDAVQRLKETTADKAFAVVSTQQIGAVRGVERILAAPWYLGCVLAVLAIGTLAHTLLLTTRRRRKDLAVLKTFGFVGRQVRATIAWIAVTIVAPALVIGLPLGIVVGRWGWRMFALYLAVVPEPVAPVAGALLVAVGAIAVALLVATGTAAMAARVKPAAVLRTE
jgi:hypothetical protein